MKIILQKTLTVLFLIFNAFVCVSQDYLVTNKKDTVYGKIEWKSNIHVYVKNEDGKQKFRADTVDFFQRGAFRFVSVDTNFPEFLLEVKKGEITYYVESHLKSKFTLDYNKKVFLEYKDELYPITVTDDENNNDFFINPLDNPLDNTIDNISLDSSTEFKSSNFKWSFYHILGKDNTLYKLITNNNFTLDDIELLVDLSNKSLQDPIEFEKQIDTTLHRGYASGYIIPSINDTLRGSIKLNRRFILSDKINFNTQKGKELSFKPDDLIGFRINDRVYKNIAIDKKEKRLIQLIVGEISLYRDLEKSKSYLIKEDGEYILVDKKKKFIEIFNDKPSIYKRIIENDYQPFEVKSMVRLYNTK